MKQFTLRKISTGGILKIEGRTAKAIIKAKNLDPSDWEEVKEYTKSEVEKLGDSEGDAGSEDN